MTLHGTATAAAIVYFLVFGAVFLALPDNVDRLGLTWINAAGKTEVRCYYGAVSWALAGFLAYLLANDLAQEALTGVLFLAVSVFATRLLGTYIDGGRSEAYNRQAIPIEALFVLGVSVCLFAG